MEIRTTVSLWKRILDFATVCDDEMRVRCTTGELYFKEVDPTHVFLIQLHVREGEGLVIKNPLPPTEKREPGHFVMDVTKVLTALRRARGDTPLCMTIQERESDKDKVLGDWLDLEFGGIEISGWCPSKSDRYDPKIPKLEARNRITLDVTPIKMFTQVCGDLGTDAIELAVSKRGLRLESFTADQKIVLNIPYKEFSTWEFKTSTQSKFSRDYFAVIMKALKTPCVVELELGTDLPLSLHFGAHNGAISGDMLLAPRIEGE